jgi:hypothetical protein
MIWSFDRPAKAGRFICVANYAGYDCEGLSPPDALVRAPGPLKRENANRALVIVLA